jgi:magnesium chelatase accessory protein
MADRLHTRLDWRLDAATWPHAERSRFVEAAGQRWHVQHWPRPGAPTLLLLHGTGASTHSFRGLAPLLAEHFEVIAPDLPGHGFSGPAARGRAGMHDMAGAVGSLLQALGVTPKATVGHSAGAAVAVRMALTSKVPDLQTLIGLNAALLPLRGLAGMVFAPAAKLLALNPMVPHFFAWRAGDRAVLGRLISSTGSKIDAEGTALYGRLVASPPHVAGALAMMAQWNLPALAAELRALRTPLHLLVGALDRTIPPADAARVQALVPGTTREVLPGLGHLAHEEAPALLAQRVLELLKI